ncbi:hypothetical protein LCGC14_3019390 [marine sediment metagenome]|uniref:Uncharacterized protein n=1 Tax=marine sediment metagenome TaxID=412755 RepID=A0A0F8WVS5_9ZZZZ
MSQPYEEWPRTFEVTREDSCIYINDLRIVGEPHNPKHILPFQARELIAALEEVLKPSGESSVTYAGILEGLTDFIGGVKRHPPIISHPGNAEGYKMRMYRMECLITALQRIVSVGKESDESAEFGVATKG